MTPMRMSRPALLDFTGQVVVVSSLTEEFGGRKNRSLGLSTWVDGMARVYKE